jgi:hypothetical protein
MLQFIEKQNTAMKSEGVTMDINHKLELLKDVSSDEADFDRILGKLLDTVLSQHRLRVKRYESDLREFETRYGMESAAFYERFERGEMGDAMDYFEWAGLYELYQKAQDKIRQLERTA